MSVAMAMVFMFVETAVIANVMFMVPFVVVIHVATRTVPVAFVKTPAFVARADPTGSGIRGPGPVAFMPAVMSGYGIPVTAHPKKVWCGLRGHDNHRTRRWRRGNLNADRNLGFGWNAG